jgi:outer membrane lipoprotein-sorting protein
MRRNWRAVARMAVICAVAAPLSLAASAALVPHAFAAEQVGQPLSLAPVPQGKPSARQGSALPPPAGAQLGTPSIEQVNAYLNGLIQLSGKFTQVGPDGKRSDGTLYVVRPGKLRFEYNAPSPLEIVADGTSVILRDRKLATQDLYSLSQTPLKFLLASNIDLRRDTVVRSARLEGDNFVVVVDDKTTFGGTSRIALTFDAKVTTLRHWVVTDPQGYDTTITLSNLDTAHRPDDKLFVIQYQRVL